MKNIYSYILFLSVVSLSSCSLETESYSQLNADNFYTTKERAYTALVGCYDGLQVVGGIGFPLMSEIMSDNCFGGTGAADGYGFQAIDEFDKDRSPSDTDLYNDNWKTYYKALYRCNVFLSKIDQINWQNDNVLRNTYESEARFIRAYLYFEMVRIWGNIPLLLTPSSENLPQTDPDEVYTAITKDLLYASENLPSAAYSTVANGRVTRWAAKALLARVYLYYTGYYGKSDLVGLVTKNQALQHLEDVITLSGHGLVNDFSALWPAASVKNYAGEDNKEIVFAIKYTYTSDYNGNSDGNPWMVMFGMREFSYVPYGNGWGVTVNSKLWNAYSAGDTRQAATMIGIAEEAIPFDKINNQREYTGYYNKKYSPMSEFDSNGNVVSVVDGLGGNGFQLGQFQDYTVIRYADVLLMAAELGSANSQVYFDQVRQRAFKTNFISIPANQINIMKERRLEFALEGIRYWDLLRQGVGVAASEIAESTTLLSGGVSGSKTITAARIESTKGLSQIPSTQITLSGGVLKQNAGW